MIEAKVICDSINKDGVRITTFQVRAPKFIDAELRTHRMLSQNSSSDRAIPFNKMVAKEFYFPDDVRKNQKGMQGYEKLNEVDTEAFHKDLRYMLDEIVEYLVDWDGIVHKQHLNRYLLGFSMQDKVITGTEWNNFFKLRLAADAQPEIQEVARKMKEAMDKSTPELLKPGQWHLPYVSPYDEEGNPSYYSDAEVAIKCSVARCARVSYSNHDGTAQDVEKDLKLYDFLVSSGHLSPLEHQATPMQGYDIGINESSVRTWENGISHMDKDFALWSANFRSWIQYRKTQE